MRLNDDNISLLGNHLKGMVSYGETYNEVYDHILSAVEVYPEGESFSNAMENIINNELGGAQGIAAMENAQKNASFSETQRQYLGNAIQYLKFPAVIIIAASAVVLYSSVRLVDVEPKYVIRSYMWLCQELIFFPLVTLKSSKRLKSNTTQNYFNLMLGVFIIAASVSLTFIYISSYYIQALVIAFVIIVFWSIGKNIKKQHVITYAKPLYLNSILFWLFLIPFLVPATLIILFGIISVHDHALRAMWLKHITPGFITGFIVIYVLHLLSVSKIYLNESKMKFQLNLS